MSPADSAVLGAAAFVLIVLVVRRIVQANRGQAFTRDELTLVVGSVVIVAAAAVVFRSPSLVKWVPSLFFLVGGLYLFVTQRGDTQSSRQFRLIGGAAAVLGFTQFVVPVLFSLVAGPPP